MLKIDGNVLELNSTSGGCLAAFRHYRMIIDITMPGKKSRTLKASLRHDPFPKHAQLHIRTWRVWGTNVA
jgi:hypothetical protein